MLLQLAGQYQINEVRWRAVTEKGEVKMYSPEEISMMLPRKLTEAAEKHFGGKDVKDVVITVPAYFSNAQRQVCCAVTQSAVIKKRACRSHRMLDDRPCCRTIYVQQSGDDTSDWACTAGD